MSDTPYHHGNLKSELIESGIKLISENGMNDFSLRKVAAKCGVSHAAPYSHFKDIQELSHAMGIYVTEKFMEQLSAAIEGINNSHIAVRLLGNAYISFFSENPHYFQFLFYHSNVSINLNNNERDDYPPFALFKKTAYQMFRDKKLPEELYLNNLLALWSMVHGTASLLTNKCIHYSGNWSEVLTDNIFIGGLEHENDHT